MGILFHGLIIGWVKGKTLISILDRELIVPNLNGLFSNRLLPWLML